MSVEDAKAYIKKLNEDPEFRKKMEDAPDNETRKGIVQEAGFDFNREDIKAAFGSGELSEEELEKAAGGVNAGVAIGGGIGIAAGATIETTGVVALAFA